MTKCIYCRKEFADDFVECEFDNPILFCSKNHRRLYIRDIIDKIHGLKDIELKKLKEHVLDKGLLYVIIDELEEREDVENNV